MEVYIYEYIPPPPPPPFPVEFVELTWIPSYNPMLTL